MGEGYIDNEDIASIGTYTYEDTPPAMYQVKVGLERNSWHHDDDDGSFFWANLSLTQQQRSCACVSNLCKCDLLMMKSSLKAVKLCA